MMNADQVKGEARDVGGKIQETAGNVTGDTSLQSAGLSDQLSGKLQKGIGDAREAITQTAVPLVDKARAFAKARPFAAAALAGVVGVAILNTLRGKTKY